MPPLLTKMNSGNFKRWFGRSKIVDQTGAPRVLYHGTSGTFKQFKPGVDGFIHVGTAGQANIITQKDRNKYQSQNIIPLLASIQNPLRLPDLGTWDTREMLAYLSGVTSSTDPRVNPIFNKQDMAGIFNRLKTVNANDPYLRSETAKKIIISEIERKGYDGIVYQNTREVDYAQDNGPQDSYIVFKSQQLKSVFNSGDYNVGNPNFMASVKYETDPSDKPIDQPVEPNRETTRKETRQMENQIKQDTTFTQGGTVSPSKLGIFSKGNVAC